MRFLQLLCENHNPDLQDHLREQKNADKIKLPHQFDFVKYLSSMLTSYVKNFVNCYSTDLGIRIMETLVEFVQGPCKFN